MNERNFSMSEAKKTSRLTHLVSCNISDIVCARLWVDGIGGGLASGRGGGFTDHIQ